MDKIIPNRRNTENRQKLISAARDLFYNQGYDATTLAQISEKSGVNNGLITYYFGSKYNLAHEIYTNFVLEMRNTIAERLYAIQKDYKLELGIGIEQRVLMEVKFNNPKLMRFFEEYIKSESAIEGEGESGRRGHYYQLQKRLINPSLSDIDLTLYEVCGVTVIRAITNAYAHNRIECDTEYLEDYALNLIYSMLQLPPYQIDALIQESKALQKLLDIKVGPGFRVITK